MNEIRKNCKYRHDNGNCLKIGGFCLAVSDEHCERIKEMSGIKCEHGLSIKENHIGEKICYCELWAEWRNITLGDCIGSCESEERAGEQEWAE